MNDVAAFNIWLCILFIMLTAKFDPEHKFSVWCFRTVAALGVITAIIRMIINAT